MGLGYSKEKILSGGLPPDMVCGTLTEFILESEKVIEPGYIDFEAIKYAIKKIEDMCSDKIVDYHIMKQNNLNYRIISHYVYYEINNIIDFLKNNISNQNEFMNESKRILDKYNN
jgi:hypothetical protein